MTISDEELRARAEAATPGPWVQVGRDRVSVASGSLTQHVWTTPRDAAYIAAANPSTILSLLDRLAALEARPDVPDDCPTCEAPQNPPACWNCGRYLAPAAADGGATE